MAVLSWTRAFQSVPNQLIRRMVAGGPRKKPTVKKPAAKKDSCRWKTCVVPNAKTKETDAAERRNNEAFLPNRLAENVKPNA